MKYLKLCVLAVVAILASASCRSQYDLMLQSNDVDAKFKAAMDYFNRHKYQKAAALFESMAVLANGTEKDDSVNYYWGLSNYKYKDYLTAETNFSEFLGKFPQSKFAAEAAYLRLVSTGPLSGTSSTRLLLMRQSTLSTNTSATILRLTRPQSVWECLTNSEPVLTRRLSKPQSSITRWKITRLPE